MCRLLGSYMLIVKSKDSILKCYAAVGRIQSLLFDCGSEPSLFLARLLSISIVV